MIETHGGKSVEIYIENSRTGDPDTHLANFRFNPAVPPDAREKIYFPFANKRSDLSQIYGRLIRDRSAARSSAIGE